MRIRRGFFKNILELFYFFTSRFLFKNNGVLFENDLIQIGVKSEFRQNLGRLGLFYGNKTQFALEVCARYNQFCEKNSNIWFVTIVFLPQSFQPVLVWSNETSVNLNVQMKPVEPALEAGAQIQQMLTAECIDDYKGTTFTERRNGANSLW